MSAHPRAFVTLAAPSFGPVHSHRDGRARTEELRALVWKEVDLVGDPDKDVPPWIAVWWSVRAGGDTKTRRSRRSLALPRRYEEGLKAHRELQRQDKAEAGKKWKDHDLVFASLVGTPLDAHNVRRAFRKIPKDAGLRAYYWTPREMRHSFVSLLSDSGVPLEEIARLVGHRGTAAPRRSTPTRSAPSCSAERR
ncbi:tyrosine-type recombinase/integrase [Nonomuraea guangzhouensis]|uniref:Tyrosine-type recombinase/integrase n=1 Tax=Nonomuraea guangzhouensis TaxID=1291555 RepID=A0ABW4GPW0_9ACTN|nr:tyrosine-type recombinase/integrase [Nonomuraea guangzhouensis]